MGQDLGLVARHPTHSQLTVTIDTNSNSGYHANMIQQARGGTPQPDGNKTVLTVVVVTTLLGNMLIYLYKLETVFLICKFKTT